MASEGDDIEDPRPILARAASRVGVTDAYVLDAMRRVDRRLFVPTEAIADAPRDAPVPIGSGQTTSQPSLIALMLQALDLKGHERVLEIGGGYGYQTALLCELAREVWSIEREAGLAFAARANLVRYGASNVTVVVGDGTKGLAAEAPFDGIIVSAATEAVPPAWPSQLVDGGRLVVPLGGRGLQRAVVMINQNGRLTDEHVLSAVRFVPLRSDP